MFGFLKPKRSSVEMGVFFADVLPTILFGSGEEMERTIVDLVSSGAAQPRIRTEFAVFNCFVAWHGMASALQRGTVGEPQFDVMLEAFYLRLDELSESWTLDPNVSMSYSSFAEYLHARLDVYINVATTSDGERFLVLIVERFCDYACDVDPTAMLKRMVRFALIRGSEMVYNTLSSTRLR
jgi:hypothetical protein